MNPKLKKFKALGYFILPVGHHRQSHPWTCGAAALKIVLDYYGTIFTESKLAKKAETTEKEGTNPTNLIKTAEKAGFKAEDKAGLTESEVKEYIKKGIPVIANYQWKPQKGEGHYSVIIGFNNQNFLLSDPAENIGYYKVSIVEFMKNWYELEDKTEKEGIIISKKS